MVIPPTHPLEAQIIAVTMAQNNCSETPCLPSMQELSAASSPRPGSRHLTSPSKPTLQGDTGSSTGRIEAQPLSKKRWPNRTTRGKSLSGHAVLGLTLSSAAMSPPTPH